MTELESALTSGRDSGIWGGVKGEGGWVEDEVELGLEGIWRDMAIEESWDGEQVKGW